MRLLLTCTPFIITQVAAFMVPTLQQVRYNALGLSTGTPVIVRHHADLSYPKTTTTVWNVAGDEQFATAFDKNLKQDRLSNLYKATYLVYGAFALKNLRIHNSLSYGCLLASAPMLAAALAFILSGAASKDNLFLFTSKRYNLTLLAYGLCQLAVVILAGRQAPPQWLIPPVLAIISSIQGYSFGVRGWALQKPAGTILNDFKKTIAQINLSFLKLPKNLKSGGYLGATLMLATMKLVKLKEIAEIVLDASNKANGGILVPLARFGRLALFTSVVYSLKDGADRGILDDSTSLIQLNVLSSASFAALAAYVGVSTQIGVLAAFFSIFCAWNSAMSIFSKKNRS